MKMKITEAMHLLTVELEALDKNVREEAIRRVGALAKTGDDRFIEIMTLIQDGLDPEEVLQKFEIVPSTGIEMQMHNTTEKGETHVHIDDY